MWRQLINDETGELQPCSMPWDEKYAIQVKVECAQTLDDKREEFTPMRAPKGKTVVSQPMIYKEDDLWLDDDRYMEFWNSYARTLNFCVGPTEKRKNGKC